MLSQKSLFEWFAPRMTNFATEHLEHARIEVSHGNVDYTRQYSVITNITDSILFDVYRIIKRTEFFKTKIYIKERDYRFVLKIIFRDWVIPFKEDSVIIDADRSKSFIINMKNN